MVDVWGKALQLERFPGNRRFTVSGTGNAPWSLREPQENEMGHGSELDSKRHGRSVGKGTKLMLDVCGGETGERELVEVGVNSVGQQFLTGGNFVPQEMFGSRDIFGCQVRESI